MFTISIPVSAQTLRDEAERAGMLVGTAVRPAHLSEPSYSSSLAREYNLIEAEDAMKWRMLRPNAATFDFQQGDELVRFAQANQMKVRGHCLVWGRDNPEWLAKGGFSSRQLSTLLNEHITRVMKHYSGEVFAWDVINEAMDENGNIRDSIWYNEPGIGFSGNGIAYIEEVFRLAHKADPAALLFFNEAEAEGLNRKSDAIYAMLKEFKRQKVPIDGIGLQMHIPTLDIDVPSIFQNIHRLVALGMQVHITEFDVSLPLDADGHATPADFDRQSAIYRGIVRACLDSPGCTAIQTWGFTDKYSWIGSHSRGTRGAALPFDRSYQPKPAYRAMFDELAKGRTASH